jgi:hypothetical protein
MRAWEWSESSGDWLTTATRGAWTVEAWEDAPNSFFACIVRPIDGEALGGFSTLEEAQRAAEDAVARLVAPFVEAEREAIRAEVERLATEAARDGDDDEAKALYWVRDWIDTRKDGAK